MKTEKLVPLIEKTVEFDFSRQKLIPETFGCYAISNFESEIIYIGKAVNLKQRFGQHLDNSEKTGMTKLGRAYWFSFRLCVDEYEISRLERGWLNHFELNMAELPLLNKIHAG